MGKILAAGAVVTGLVTSVLTLLVAFGVPISPDQHTAIEGVVGSVLTVLGLWFAPAPVGLAARFEKKTP